MKYQMRCVWQRTGSAMLWRICFRVYMVKNISGDLNIKIVIGRMLESWNQRHLHISLVRLYCRMRKN